MTFEMAAEGVRHVAPKVDGITEVRCKLKGLQVIAAERCVQAQATGCACERMASAAVVEEAHRAGCDEIAPQRQIGGSAGVSTIPPRERPVLGKAIADRLLARQTPDTVADALGLTLAQVAGLRKWWRRQKYAPHGKNCSHPSCTTKLHGTNRSGLCTDHRTEAAETPCPKCGRASAHFHRDPAFRDGTEAICGRCLRAIHQSTRVPGEGFSRCAHEHCPSFVNVARYGRKLCARHHYATFGRAA